MSKEGKVLEGEVEDITGARSTLSSLVLAPFAAGYSVPLYSQCFHLGPEMSARITQSLVQSWH